ncbi:MAG: hypothetical protein ACYDBW_05740 [Sulfuricaulis sp.]
MNTSIQLYGKVVRVELSAAAERALEKRTAPLFAEVQLIFGCMVAKRVWFRDEANPNAVAVAARLNLWFRPARYAKACSFDEIDGGAEASDYPVVGDRGRFVPDVVSIDYRGGKWAGDFTYSMELFRTQNAALEQAR